MPLCSKEDHDWKHHLYHERPASTGGGALHGGGVQVVAISHPTIPLAAARGRLEGEDLWLWGGGVGSRVLTKGGGGRRE